MTGGAMMTDTTTKAVQALIEGVYRVERDGSVFSIIHNWRGKGERQITPTVNAHGYLSVRISVGGTRKHFPVHRLVAAFYLPPKPTDNHEIRHIDGNRLNPKAENLAWGTRSENAKDRSIHGTEKIVENAAKTLHMRMGEKSSAAKLNNEDAIEIRRRADAGESSLSIAKDYPKVSYSSVANVVSRKTFRFVQ